MTDVFQIVPPVVRAEGKDVPPEQIQAGFNSLARQTQLGLNSVATDPSGPASGDLGGMYPAPTVVSLHVTSGTESGVTVTGNTIDSSPIGQTTPAAGAFTTLTATTPVGVASGGTGQNTLSAHNVLLGEGTGGVGFAAPSTAGRMLISQGAAVDPAFANNPVITGGSIDGTPVGATSPNTGAFTTLAASNTVSGTGFSTYLASPPAIGGTAANAGSFTTLSASSTVSGAGFTTRFASPGPIGNTAASTGAFTTLSSSGTFTPSSTNGIVGTTTNDNANAGSVGEFVTASGSGTSLTSAVAANATSISLTAGDWDVEGSVQFLPSGVTSANSFIAGVSTTSATIGSVGSLNAIQFTMSSPGANQLPTPVLRLSLALTTTVFLVAAAAWTGGTMTCNSLLRARRVR